MLQSNLIETDSLLHEFPLRWAEKLFDELPVRKRLSGTLASYQYALATSPVSGFLTGSINPKRSSFQSTAPGYGAWLKKAALYHPAALIRNCLK